MTMPPISQMKKRRSKHMGQFDDQVEWLDHRYDPGYFTGGNVDPLLRARRPNPLGYLYLLVGPLGLRDLSDDFQ